MKILLIGEYSNVHHTLCLGLRALGHDVTLASDGDGWKDYPRDIDLRRRSMGRLRSLWYYWRTLRMFRTFRGYDVVQIIGAEFLPLKAGRIARFYRMLRRHNRHLVLGAYGMDYYYVRTCLDRQTFRYSDFNFGPQERVSDINDRFKREWLDGAKGRLNRSIARHADHIIAGLYEYYASYRNTYHGPAPLTYIPFPIVLPKDPPPTAPARPGEPLRVFIGIQQTRSEYKGTDVMLRAARRAEADSKGRMRLHVARNVPFARYVEMLNDSDVILDQLYSYTPAMNALEAMAHGLVPVGGGEEEAYALMGEHELRPVVNVQPDEESVYRALCRLVSERDTLVPRLKAQGRAYLERHHDHIAVARRYEQIYRQL